MSVKIKAMMLLRCRTFLISNLFLLLLVLPAAVTAFGIPSMSYGTLLSALIIIAYGVYINKGESIFFFQGAILKILALIPIVILIHTLLIFFLQNQAVDFSRLIFSIFLLEIILISIIFLNQFIADMNQKDFDFCIIYIFVILVVISFLGLFGFFSFGRSGRPIVFFNEPSHYVLVFSPFFLWNLYRARNILIKYLILVLVFLISLSIQSVILSLVVIVSTFITMRFKNTVIALLILFVFQTGFNSMDFKSNMNSGFFYERETSAKYFSKRLPILNEETKLYNSEKTGYFDPSKYLNLLIKDSYNGSLLALISGWERALMNLEDTRAMGFGFQQFGILGRWGSATYKIVSIYRMPLCLTDGASIAPKVIGEFGLLGILLILIYTKFSFLKLQEFRRHCINPSDHTALKYIFYISCIISFSLSIFIRGVGYFTAESFLFFLSILGVLIKSKFGRAN
jgi:hypothetical protein